METTFCPRCKKIIAVDTYLNSDECPSCGYNLNRGGFIVVAAFSIIMAIVSLFAANKFPAQKIQTLGMAGAFIFFGVVEITGEILMRKMGVAKALRRRIMPLLAIALTYLLIKFVILTH